MLLRAAVLRRPLVAAGGAALACAAGSYAQAETSAAEPQKSTVWSWGRLVPAAADEQRREKERSPIQVSFWASQGLGLKLVSYGSSHGAAVDSKGGLWAWSDSTGPVPRKLPCAASLTSLASTDGALYAVTSRGKVLQWDGLAGSLGSAKPPAEPRPMGGELAKIGA
eukprot:6577271-Prymnesium_polylepis.1